MHILVSLLVAAPLAGAGRNEAAAPSNPDLFAPIADVLTHPRCINCHQDASPRQMDAKIIHQPLVVRGKDGHGAPTQRCQTCHQLTNTADGFVPGVRNWGLAPLSMLWEGKTRSHICEQIKDPGRNGGRRTGAQIIEHMKSDPLVLWGWNPGAGRSTPPLSHAAFVGALDRWVKAGMPCPNERAERPSSSPTLSDEGRCVRCARPRHGRCTRHRDGHPTSSTSPSAAGVTRVAWGRCPRRR